MCKDTEPMGRGKVRLDDSAREQSTGEDPGDKLKAEGTQRRQGQKDSEGRKGKWRKGKKKRRKNGQKALGS